jgi:hypothetical protein
MVITYLENLRNNKNVKYYIIGFNLMIRSNFSRIRKLMETVRKEIVNKRKK